MFRNWGPNFEVGQPVVYKTYSFIPYDYVGMRATDISGLYIRESTREIIFDTENGRFAIVVEPVMSDYIVVERFLDKGSVAHVRSEKNGQDRVFKVFPPKSKHNDTAATEFHANRILSQNGYPVATDVEVGQLFYPWQDTYSYKYIVRESLYHYLEDSLAQGNIEQASECMRRFGIHLQVVWADLLDGRKYLSNGDTFWMDDNMTGAFIVTGNPTIHDAFIRVDLQGTKAYRAIGLANRIDQLTEEIHTFFSPHADQLIKAFLMGLAEASKV